MKATDAMLAELRREAEATRRALERVQEARLSWAPHPKSMTLGTLALHIAQAPGRIAEMLRPAVFESTFQGATEARSVAEILSAHDESVKTATHVVGSWNEEDLDAPWKLLREGKALLEAPRGFVARSLLLNHTYHHRGQLTVYLRLLDAPVPPIYGPTADENPFA